MEVYDLFSLSKTNTLLLVMLMGRCGVQYLGERVVNSRSLSHVIVIWYPEGTVVESPVARIVYLCLQQHGLSSWDWMSWYMHIQCRTLVGLICIHFFRNWEFNSRSILGSFLGLDTPGNILSWWLSGCPDLLFIKVPMTFLTQTWKSSSGVRNPRTSSAKLSNS